MILGKIQFPLEGALAELLLIVEWIISFLFLELTLILWKRIIRNKNELKSLQEKAYFWIYLGFSLMWIFFIFSDFYVKTSVLRWLFLNFGYISLEIGAILFIYIIEIYKIFIKKHLFTIIFIIDIIIFFFVLIFAVEYTQIMSFTFWLLFIVFFSLYSKELQPIFNYNIALGSYKYKYLKLLSGVILVIVGFGLTTDFSINTLGLAIRLLGDILQILGMVLLFLFFISIPSFSEYDWKDKINNVLIVLKSGLFIYKKYFQNENDPIYDSVISGVITSLKMMLDTVSANDDISIIEKKGKIVIIQPGKYIYGVLICDENLNSLQILLSNFIEKIETIYSNVLENWDGDLKVFKPINDFAKEIFV